MAARGALAVCSLDRLLVVRQPHPASAQHLDEAAPGGIEDAHRIVRGRTIGSVILAKHDIGDPVAVVVGGCAG
jgi:hypothetical protein